MNANSTDRLARRWGWLGLLAIAALTLLPGLWEMPLLDRDEPRFARATIEMSERGDWLIPYFNEEYRFDKPPLTYWWMQLNYLLFGQSEGAARLHSVLCTWLAAVFILGFGSRLFRPATGFLAAAGFLLCGQVLVHGRLAVADMPMVAAVVLIMWQAWELLADPGWDPFKRPFWLLWTSVAVGFLAKGPIVLLVPVLAWLITAFVFRQRLPWRRLQPVTGPAFALILIALWGVPALSFTEGAYWDVGMGLHVVERGLEAFNSRRPHLLYYVGTIFISLLPWVAFGGAAIAKIRRAWDVRTAYLLAWFIAPVVIFTAYATQLPHYILPGFAGFCLILFRPVPLPAAGWKRESCHPLAAVSGKGLEPAFFWLLLVLWSSLAGLLLTVASLLPIATGMVAPRGALAGFAFAIIGLIMLAICLRRRFSPKMWPGYAFSLLLVAVGFAAFVQNFRPLVPAIQLESVFLAEEASELRWSAYGYSEPSLVFYRRGPWSFPEHQPSAEDVAAENSASLVLAREWRIDSVVDAAVGGYWPPVPTTDRTDAIPPPPVGYAVQEVSGLNLLGRASWVDLRLYVPSEVGEASN